MAGRMCWSKGARTSINGAKTFELKKDGECLAVVQQFGSDIWFSYGMSNTLWNTSGEPKSLLEAKDDAVKRAKEAMK